MPQSIPKGLTRESVLTALADLDAAIEHPFGTPTGYVLVHDGKHYPPKAVIGLACRSLLGRVLLPEEFSGGEAPGQANYVLDRPRAQRDAPWGGESRGSTTRPNSPLKSTFLTDRSNASVIS